MEVYYHYTDKKGLDAITQGKFMKQSSRLDNGDDAFHGNGVYFTNMAPSAGKQKIAHLCWGNGGPSRVQAGRVDYAIVIRVPSGVIKKATKAGVYLYLGNLNLNSITWEVVVVPN